MLIVSYDFGNDKVRTKFAKFLKQYGHKIQYSVYEVQNSQRILKIILVEIELTYKKLFQNTDSILIFKMCGGCMDKIARYGYAEHDKQDVVYFS